MVKDNSLYDKLELTSTATENDIKKAYARLSKKWHPDKNPNNIEEATRKFQEINEAKEILLNPEKRTQYDMGSSNNNDVSNFFNEVMKQHFSFNTNFSFNFNNQNTNVQPEVLENIIANLNVTLEQIYNQDEISFSYKYKHYCSKCNGYGTDNGSPPCCNKCNGKGMIVQIHQTGFSIQQIANTCDKCLGSGKYVNSNCNNCVGSGFELKDRQLSVKLDLGLSSGNEIKLTSKGHNYKNDKTDLILIIQEQPHTYFKRQHNNLLIDIELQLYEALYGFNKLITYLDGSQLNLFYRGITDYGTTRRAKNYGMHISNSSDKGDLIINFTFKLPNLSLEVINLLHEKNDIQHEDISKLNISKITLI